VIVVVDLSTSTDQTVRNALRLLEAVHAPVVGLVVNRDRGAQPSSYDYYVTADATADEGLAKSGAERG
jgi:Mrp family chromosome partitioning ATPase